MAHSIGAGVKATAGVKHSFFRQYLVAARHFADLAARVESSAAVVEPTEREKSEHRAYVTGAVVFIEFSCPVGS